jgi:hypothetical protein
MPAKITVTKSDEETFEVRITEANSESRHTVTLKDADYQRLSEEKIPREELIRRSFEFLLLREPKESILATFNLTVISRYFPTYEREIKSGLT